MLEKLTEIMKQKNTILYLIIFAVTLLLCQNFLQMHYSSDTYVLYDLGYMQYPLQYFIPDGRFISALVCFIAGFFNIPMNIYIVAMDFIGIVFISMAIYVIYNLLKKLINPSKTIFKVMLLASCFILILNQYSLEYLLFPESAVMCLGMLFLVIATKLMIEKPQDSLIKIFLLLLCAGLSYQVLLNIFPVLVILVLIVKHIIDNKPFKERTKELKKEFIDIVKIAIIFLVVILILYMILKIVDNNKRGNILGFAGIPQFSETKRIMMMTITEMWVNSCNMLPKNINNVIVILTFILLFILKARKQTIIEYIGMLMIIFIMFIIQMFIFRYNGVCERLYTFLMMVWGASLIILLTQASILEEGKRNFLIYVLVCISFIINSIFIMQNITEHIASNRVEENMGKTIKYALEKYEKQTGNTVTKFAYFIDENPQQCAVGIKPRGTSLTERKLGCRWSIDQTINYYCERKFERVKFSYKLYQKKIEGKDYTVFSEDQLIFEGDTLYMIVY